MLSTRISANLMQSNAAWAVPLLLILSMLLIHQWPGSLNALDYASNKLSSEPWRWWSAHLVHLDAPHLVANLLAFTAVCLIFAPWLQGFSLLGTVLVSATVASLVPWLVGQSANFAGFSGVLHGLLLYGCVRVTQQHWLGYLLLGVLMLKLLIELYTGYQLSVEETESPGLSLAWLANPTAYWAHIGGAVGGAIALLPGYVLNCSRSAKGS